MITKQSGTSTVMGAIALCLASLSGAAAAPGANPAQPTAQAETVRNVAAVTEGEDDSATCTRARRRLFVDGEGWIVRWVTTCR